ncbi:hypothetical protein BLS_000313 [Venturia inaequalis]|uniref:Gamma-glutamyltransferase n=1 Tax=Venturia inaequalis TaxID=5025 RepID=A0A8H3YJ55_VENIN|nr:hypothetical protein BLS_000313 [Venturia inaequalis]
MKSTIIAVLFLAAGATADYRSESMGQTQLYADMKLVPHGNSGDAHTANLIGAMNAVNSAGSALGAILVP